jgi:adenylate kinase
MRASALRLGGGLAAHGNNLVFLGAPGVGKGTFAARIAPRLGVPAISTGDLIRAETKAGSALGRELQAFTAQGRLVPDEVVSRMVRERLQAPDAARGWILDGYPRTVQQARDLDAAQDVSRVINITLPEHVLEAKLLGRRACGDCGRGYNVAAIHEGELDMPPLLPKPTDCDKCKGKPRLTVREDDTAAVVAERMQVYARQTRPLIDYYSAQGKLQDFAVKKGVADVPRMVTEMGIVEGKA